MNYLVVWRDFRGRVIFWILKGMLANKGGRGHVPDLWKLEARLKGACYVTGGGATWGLRCVCSTLFAGVLGCLRHLHDTGRSDTHGRLMVAWNSCWGQVEEDIWNGAKWLCLGNWLPCEVSNSQVQSEFLYLWENVLPEYYLQAQAKGFQLVHGQNPPTRLCAPHAPLRSLVTRVAA